MILLWLLCLCDWATAQDCWPLQHDNQSHHGTIFGDVDAEGIVLGNLAIGGDADFSQLSAGAALSSDADWALLVQGNLDMRCGDVGGQVFHGGSIEVGPRLDWHGYVASTANIGSLYSFSGAEDYYKGLSLNLGLLDKRGFGRSQLHTFTLALIGEDRTNEMFFVTCEDLANAREISFSGINVGDSTTVIINAGGLDCSIDVRFNSISGLGWKEPSGHILWNFYEATALTLSRSVVGSVLAPNAQVTANKAYVEGQVIFQSLKGQFYFGAKLFRGCVPTDPCTVASSTCRLAVPSGCNSPVPVPDPNDSCCITSYKCDECPDVCPTAEDLQCNPRFRPQVIVPPVSSPNCCDTWACIEVDGVTENDPLSISCPLDFSVTIEVGRTRIQVTWDQPEFLYVQSVSSSHTSPTTFSSPGEYIIHYTAVGLKQNTFAGCYFAVNVVSTSFSSGCNVGGVSYGEGEQFLDSCMKQCICGPKGAGVFCTRIRKELGGMNIDERARYWATYKSAYNHEDGIIRDHVDNHLKFFSRGLHNNGAFLPWHRGYILQMENRLQKEDCKVTVPYWNWRLAPRVNQANHWGEDEHHASGNGDNRRCVKTGTFGELNGFQLTSGSCLQRRIGGGSTATVSTIQSQIFGRYGQASQYDQMRNRLEHGPGMHDSVHCLVGGTMCSARASNDPIFFTHHANIDKIWSEWQALSDAHLNFYTGSTNEHALMPTSQWTPREMMHLHNQPGGVRVMYYEDQVITTLNTVVGLMTPTESDRLGRPAVGPVGEEWLEDMHMDKQDIDTIRLAEKLANSDVIEDAVMMTMKNAVERTVEAADLLNTIRQVAARTAIHIGDSLDPSSAVTADALFRALTATFVKSNVVPRFSELQDIILTAEDGAVVDVVTIAFPIECPTVHSEVCASGQTFPSLCQAQQQGYDVSTPGPCPLPPAPQTPVDPAIDGGDSEAYNHEIQELRECPLNLGVLGASCPIIGMTCYYGLSCCSVSEITATCNENAEWAVINLNWQSSCANVPTCNSVSAEPQSGANVQITTRSPTPAITRRPTAAPTDSPTRRPTHRPSRSPTRILSIPRPINQLRLSGPNPNIVVPSSTRRPNPPRPLSASSSHIPSTSRPRTFRPISNALLRKPVGPPLIIPSPICPISSCLESPMCCGSGAEIGRPPIFNAAGVQCGQGCETCMRSNFRPAPVPICCRTPLHCPAMVCIPTMQPVLVVPKGTNGEAPCCDRYQCQLTLNPCGGVVCPQVETAICANRLTEVPRFVTSADIPKHSLQDPLGCCQNIICVAVVCPMDTRLCLDGTLLTRLPTSVPPCLFALCPAICPDPMLRLFCPASGGKLVERARNSAEHTQSCEWQPCLPYEPCEDATLAGCGANGDCIRGRSVLACTCNDGFSGPTCQTFTEPVRPTRTVHDKSFAVMSTPGFCWLYWCSPIAGNSACYGGYHVGGVWDVFSDAIISFPNAMSVVGHSPTFRDDMYFFVVNKDFEMDMISFNDWVVSEGSSVDADFTRAVQASDWAAAITDFSHFTVKDGTYPPHSEARHILNLGDYCPGSVSNTASVFLSDVAIVIYDMNDDQLQQLIIPWVDPVGNTQLLDVCPDLCLNDDGERNTCNNNGICVRESGDCLCDFGWRGELCQSLFET